MWLMLFSQIPKNIRFDIPDNFTTKKMFSGVMEVFVAVSPYPEFPDRVGCTVESQRTQLQPPTQPAKKPAHVILPLKKGRIPRGELCPAPRDGAARQAPRTRRGRRCVCIVGRGRSQGPARFGATFIPTSTYIPAAKLPDLGLGRESRAPGSPECVGGTLRARACPFVHPS